MKKWFWKNQNEWKKQRNCCRSRYYQTQHNRLLALSGTKCHAAAALRAINDDRSTPHYVCLPPQLSPLEFWGPPTFGFLHVLSLYRDQEDAIRTVSLRGLLNVLINLFITHLTNKTKNINKNFLRDTESAPLRGGLHRRAL